MQVNYFPINIDFDSYQVLSEPYTEERLKELRKKHNNTHSFFRNEDSIYISNKEGDESISIGLVKEKKVFDDSAISSSLIKHIFFRTFKKRFKKYIPVDFYPFRFYTKLDKNDIIYSVLPKKLKGRIAYKKLIELHLRLTEIDGVKRFGFLINIRRNWVFDISCEELHSEGYDLIGKEVLYSEMLPGLENVLAPNEELVGTIKTIKDNNAVVVTNEGDEEYSLSELFLRKTKSNIYDYLSFADSEKKSNEVFNTIKIKREEIYNHKKLHSEILNIAKLLFSYNGAPILFNNKDGFCFTIDTTPLQVKNSISLNSPTFIFDPAKTKTNRNADIGLNNYGPYDSSFFETKSPNILCICNKRQRGTFTQFLNALKEGLPNTNYFKQGLERKYSLYKVIYHVKEIHENTRENYFKVLSDFDDLKPDLAIIEIPEDFRKTDANLYYEIKAKFLSQEIPVQFITTGKINGYNQYILNSISLQIYAKIGGTPWVLPSQPTLDREIVVGIGHSWLRKNQHARSKQDRVVGITNFFRSDGQYILGDKVKDVDFEDYFEELLKSLKSSIERISQEQGWIVGETVRLIFHIFKPIKNTEFEVISELVREISHFKIQFAFVTISTFHPFTLFDPNQKGLAKHSSTKGEFIPKRASNVFLDAETSLIQMFGPTELKSSVQGISKPIQIRIRTPQGKYENEGLNNLLFYDLAYITQQIFSFTYLSWRSFLSSDKPATMLYSNLISRLLGRMRGISGWDPDRLNYGLKQKKWFL